MWCNIYVTILCIILFYNIYIIRYCAEDITSRNVTHRGLLIIYPFFHVVRSKFKKNVYKIVSVEFDTVAPVQSKPFHVPWNFPVRQRGSHDGCRYHETCWFFFFWNKLQIVVICLLVFAGIHLFRFSHWLRCCCWFDTFDTTGVTPFPPAGFFSLSEFRFELPTTRNSFSLVLMSSQFPRASFFFLRSLSPATSGDTFPPPARAVFGKERELSWLGSRREREVKGKIHSWISHYSNCVLTGL